jgi:hypothetical protein
MYEEHHLLEDYQSGVPRWCNGCGDNAILAAVQRLCRDEDLRPEKTVFVSGIGCSSRFPHYMKTYGFHGIHGRALPIAQGIKMARPDLHVFVNTGDGDNCSIGTAHWIHAIRYNMNMTMILHDSGPETVAIAAKAADLEESVFEHILGQIQPGQAGHMAHFFSANGHDDTSFSNRFRCLDPSPYRETRMGFKPFDSSARMVALAAWRRQNAALRSTKVTVYLSAGSPGWIQPRPRRRCARAITLYPTASPSSLGSSSAR